MSAPERTVRLTARAHQDLDGLLLSSGSTWGPEQADRDDGAMACAFAALGGQSHLGFSRDHLAPGRRSLPVERHILYDRSKGNAVEVGRILARQARRRAVFRRAV